MFITFEGLDGSGKTTIINKLYEYLWDKYPQINFILTREPGGKGLQEAEKIRNIILDNSSKLSSKTEALLYTSSRRIHLEHVIWPELEKGSFILCDRYIDSFYAYQGFGRGLGLEWVKNITELVIEKTYPDITIFFDIDAKTALFRRMSSDEQNRLDNESSAFHSNVYNGFKELIKQEPERFLIVDATQDVETVFAETVSKLESHPKFQQFISDKKLLW